VRRLVAAAAVVATLVSTACSGAAETHPTASASSDATPSASRVFCRRLGVLDDRVRAVRSYTDDTAAVEAYVRSVVVLDLAFRKMRDVAPPGFDTAPIEYANGRFGELVRAMPPDLTGPEARARVALILNSYDAAMYAALVGECGPEAAGAGAG
jgi:hypothetical protein